MLHDGGRIKVEAVKKVGVIEEDLAAHRLENSRLSLTNQRLQEEVSEVLLIFKLGRCKAPSGHSRGFSGKPKKFI